MSLTKKIVSWFKKAGDTIHKFILEISDFALENCKTAVYFLQQVKAGIDTDTFKTVKDLVVTLIPGSVDDAIVNTIVDLLNKDIPKVCTALDIAYDAAQEGTDAEKLAVILDAVSKADIDKKTAVYTHLAATIASQLSDGKISLGEALTDTQYIYNNADTFGIK